MKKLLFPLLISMITMNHSLAQNPDFLFLIEQAVKAPSGHNTQPWMFRIGETEIDICPDYSRALPVVDPDNRELFVSLGCAAENLCIAASHKGYRPTVTVAEDSTICIRLDRQADVTPSPLFAQIALRQTNRRVYDGRMIPAADIDRLQAIEIEHAVNIHFYERGTPAFDAIAELIYRGNSVQMQDGAFKSELRSWMRYNKKHRDARHDGLSYDVFGAPNLPRFISENVIAGALNERSQNRSDRKKIASASHLILLTTRDNSVEQWVALGRTLERLLLTSTAMGIAHAYLNPPNELPELAHKLADTLGLPNEHPTILLRMGYAQRMPYSTRIPAAQRVKGAMIQ